MEASADLIGPQCVRVQPSADGTFMVCLGGVWLWPTDGSTQPSSPLLQPTEPLCGRIIALPDIRGIRT